MQKILDHGLMDVGGGHSVYWEMSGNLEGIPALVLHGGPGSGCRPGHYDLFDLSRYKVVLLDQRGCGRSRPVASETTTALEANTTDHLLADIEALREHLEIDKWLIFGGSWGSTLAMNYALAQQDCVLALVLAGVATTTERDLQWLYGDVGNMFPEAFVQFCAMTPDALGVPARIAAYADLLLDEATAQEAADAWCRWELAIFGQSIETVAPWNDPKYRLGFARLVTHYFRHRAWRDDGYILDNIASLQDVPAAMFHSRFDPSCPLRAPWELAQAWPASRLEILDGNDHSALSKTLKQRIRSATYGFANRF